MKYLIIILITFSLFTNPAFGASAGDDNAPPSSGGGGGGGGSPQFYDYYIPLVFDESNTYGYSEVTVWFIQRSILTTSFDLNEAGQRSVQIQEPMKITFNPIDNPGLTNGSLIRTTTPVMVTGHRSTEDIFSDQSFAYSVLIDRMMGFEYSSPVNGWINLFTLNPQTSVTIQSSNGDLTSHTIPNPGTIGSFKVKVGDKINSSYPTNGAFISYEGGTKASMTVPRYLRGDEYIFDIDSKTLNPDENDFSYLQVIPDEPTELTILNQFGLSRKLVIFDTTNFELPNDIRSIRSSRGFITVTLHQNVGYGGVFRESMVQFIDSNEMRSGELFIAPKGYSSHLAVINDNTYYVTGYYDLEKQDYEFTIKSEITKIQYESLSFVGLTDTTYIYGNHSSFGYLSSPGDVNHPMAPSQAFLNLPLNPSTVRNDVSDLLGTWFRFPNLALMKIEVLPGPPEQYTGQTIRVEFKSNGTLPASRFRVEVTIDSEIVTDEVFNFLGVNRSLIFSYTQFIDFSAHSLNITARIDVENDVNEINEDDNANELNLTVQENFRLKWSIIGISVLIVAYIVNKLRKRLKRNSELHRSHVDAIISMDIEEEPK